MLLGHLRRKDQDLYLEKIQSILLDRLPLRLIMEPDLALAYSPFDLAVSIILHARRMVLGFPDIDTLLSPPLQELLHLSTEDYFRIHDIYKTIGIVLFGL